MAHRALSIGIFLGFFLAAGAVFAQNLPPKAEILSDRILGKLSAPVTIIEYASKTCPHCAAFHTDTMPDLKKEYIDTGKVKLIYRDFPLDRLAVAAAMVARCAPSSRYFALVDLFYKSQGTWARSQDPVAELTKIGRLAGLSKATVDACLSDKEIFDGIVASRDRGQKEFNVRATPTILINGKLVNGNATMEVLRPLLDQAAKGS